MRTRRNNSERVGIRDFDALMSPPEHAAGSELWVSQGVWAESAACSATAYSEGSKRRSGQGASSSIR